MITAMSTHSAQKRVMAPDIAAMKGRGEPIVALKSYVISPFSDDSRMESIMEHVLAARRELEEK